MEPAADQQPTHPSSASSWPDWLNRREVSDYLWREHGIRLGVAALANAACDGTGPPFQKDGGKLVSYWRPDVDEWASKRRSRKVTSTSELREVTVQPSESTPACPPKLQNGLKTGRSRRWPVADVACAGKANGPEGHPDRSEFSTE